MTQISKLKLLIFTPTLQCGGAEKYVSLLCNNIDTKRFSVSLVVLNNEDPFFEIRKKSIQVIDLKVKHVRHSFFKIKRTVKQEQPDIIFTTANHLNLLFAMFRWVFPKKVCLVGWESSIVSINNRRAKFPALYDRLVKMFYKNLDLIVCQSAYMQQDLVSNYNIPENKAVVIHIPVEAGNISDTAALSKEPHAKFTFITVARLSEEKGIDRLIRAVALLSIPFQYHIIGEGSERNSLQNLVNSFQLQDSVFFAGEKTSPYQGMENADLFLMGSHYEGFPNVLLEAGALGIPVIAFDVPGGIGEIITAGNGLLVNDNDIGSFAAAIENGSRTNFNRNQIIEITKKRFSLDVIIPQTEALFIKLLSG